MFRKINSLAYFLFKFLTFVAFCVFAVFLYGKFSKYNIDVIVELSNLKIKTYTGTVVFCLFLCLSILLMILGVMSWIMAKLRSIIQIGGKAKSEKALKQLIESSVLLSVHDKKAAASHIKEIDTRYLTSDQADYLELIRSLSSSDSVPVGLYQFSSKFPVLKNQVSRKLAQIEFRMGNTDKALERIKEYLEENQADDKLNNLLAKIYASKLMWREMDSTIEAICDRSAQENADFSELYTQAAKARLHDGENQEAQDYCIKALQEDPSNITAAELFSEIAVLYKNYDLLDKILISCFGRKPNFDIFFVLKKYTSLDNEELYQALEESCSYTEHLSLFLSISTYLELQDKQKEILNQMQ